MRLDEWELLDCCHEDGEKTICSAEFSVDQNTAFNFRSISVSDRQRTIRDEQEIGAQDDEDAVSKVSGKKLIGDMKKLCSAELGVDRKTSFDLRSTSVSDRQSTIRDVLEIGALDDENAISQVSGQKLIGDIKKLCSAELGVHQKTDYNLRSTSVSDQQRTIRDEQEIGAQDDEDAVSQVSGLKLIGDMKKESARFFTSAESEVHDEEVGVNSRRMDMAVEKRQKLGIAAICSFGIAVAATICSAVGKP